MNDTITILPFTYTVKKTFTETPRQMFHIKCIPFNFLARNHKTIIIYNASEFTLEPLERKKIFLNTYVFTSLPGICTLYGDELLSFHGLSYVMNHVKSNDTLLNIDVCNITSKKLSFKEESLMFYCLITIAQPK